MMEFSIWTYAFGEKLSPLATLVPITDFHLARSSSVWLPVAEECLCFEFSFDEANADILEPEPRLALGK